MPRSPYISPNSLFDRAISYSKDFADCDDYRDSDISLAALLDDLEEHEYIGELD